MGNRARLVVWLMERRPATGRGYNIIEQANQLLKLDEYSQKLLGFKESDFVDRSAHRWNKGLQPVPIIGRHILERIT
ncbi:hypothetical protein BN77_p10772 [Rhizobium mesoamericanum STM3625]|uniref:Uncharacterized protein n=1 Tax=Rhizobium mesoamericanum STM3625 TaxID=1211777 RepID=K0Q6A0_9HYPH|nr:hypothetical protein BN77_p10772 [Rhizobium mesoamericanum STM3625]